MKNRLLKVFVIIMLVSLLSACAEPLEVLKTEAGPGALRIEATSVTRQLEEAGIFTSFTEATGIPVHLEYFGDVELMLRVQAYTESKPGSVDAMWLGSPIYAPGLLLKEKTSIMRTYIVLGVSPEAAQDLGWTLGSTISTADIIKGVEEGKLKLAVPSASQDDAGANFLLAVIQSFSNKPNVTQVDLQNEGLKVQLRTLFKAVAGSANNAAALSDLFISDRSGSSTFNGFILPESLAIRTNLELEKKNLEPMWVFYVEDAVGVQDFPLGWVDGVSEVKQQQVAKLVEYLKSDEIQTRIQQQGYFRTGVAGMTITGPDQNIFNPKWGIITDRNFLPASLPKDIVIMDALAMYQTLFKPPSQTVFCLDCSPSMEGSGDEQRNAAMEIILDQTEASRYLLQMGPKDLTSLLLFSGVINDKRSVEGNNPGILLTTYNWLASHEHGSATNVYGCAIEALQEILSSQRQDTLPAVILLTDGMHNTGNSFRDLRNFYLSNNLTVPVYSIMLGDASKGDLELIARLTNGRVCDGREGEEALVQCFKDFRGSN